MKVQEELIDDRKRYLLIDGENKPVVPVLTLLKYLDNIGKVANTDLTVLVAVRNATKLWFGHVIYIYVVF